MTTRDWFFVAKLAILGAFVALVLIEQKVLP